MSRPYTGRIGAQPRGVWHDARSCGDVDPPCVTKVSPMQSCAVDVQGQCSFDARRCRGKTCLCGSDRSPFSKTPRTTGVKPRSEPDPSAMARPRKAADGLRNRWDALYVTSAERAEVAAAAATAGQSVSQYLLCAHRGGHRSIPRDSPGHAGPGCRRTAFGISLPSDPAARDGHGCGPAAGSPLGDRTGVSARGYAMVGRP